MEYVGSRLIKDNPDNAPLLELNSTIDVVDKEAISKISDEVLETAVLIVIETNDDQYGKTNGNMCILQPTVWWMKKQRKVLSIYLRPFLRICQW